MSIGYLIAGLVFLCNPHVNIIDFMPDAIGYGLILLGITKLSHTELSMSEAHRRFKYLFILALCKLPCLYVYALISPEEQVWILLLSTCFGAAEAVLGFLAFSRLFTSLETLGNAERDHRIFTKLVRVKLITLIFTVAKPLFAVLPDLTLLADDRYGTVTGVGIQTLRSYRAVFNVFSFLAVFVFGIIWLVMAISYFNGIRKEKAFLSEVAERIASFYREDKKHVFRYLIVMLTFMIYAVFFCLELKIEGYSILPPMINGALFIIVTAMAFYFFKRSPVESYAKGSLIASVVYFIFSFVGYVLAVRFADRHYNDEIGGGFAEDVYYYVVNDFEVFDELVLVNLFVALSQVAFLVALILLVRVFRLMIEDFCGIPASTLDDKDRTPSMIERDIANDRAIKYSLSQGTDGFLTVAILTAISSALFPMLQIYVNLFFTVDLLIRILFVVVSAAYIGKLRHAVKVKGALDLDD